jgi:hypothetical protein
VAFTIDLSRLFTGASELQTVADAAALRGAQQLQRTRGVPPINSVIDFSAQNEALGAREAVPASAVEPILWLPTAANPETPASWEDANAVAVRASRTSRLLFGRVLSPSLPTTSQRAIAWIANVQSVRCPAPWGFPLAALNDAIFGQSDYDRKREYFSALQQKIADLGVYSVALVLYPEGMNAPVNTPNQVWPFQGIGPDANMNNYPEQIAGSPTCGADAVAEIDEEETFPGRAAVPQKTVRGAMGHQSVNGSLCEPIQQNKADCFPVGSNLQGNAGVDVVVSWIDQVNSNVAAVLTIGGFRVMCVFGRANGSGSNAGGQGQSCGFFTGYLNSGFAPSGISEAKLPQGTIVGYPVTMSPKLGQGTTLGNTPSLAQRLILVR